jgi:hypothetical protein
MKFSNRPVINSYFSVKICREIWTQRRSSSAKEIAANQQKSWLDCFLRGEIQMKHILWGLAASLLIVGTAQAKNASMFPKNNRYIGVGLTDQGISEADFNKVLDKVVAIYDPIVQAHGFKLQFNRLWDDGTVNSDTDTEGDQWVINSYGGLARYNGITMDAYAGVACHELGHHLGGAPLFSDGGNMSVEGEADYHVGKCFRKYVAADDNVALMRGMNIDALVVSKCTAAFLNDKEQVAICERSAIAGFVLADILRDLGGEPAIAYNTPDPSVVTTVYEDHPHAQCRLDTYLATAVCPVSSDIEFSNTDASVGACMTGDGARPRCWFAPAN